MNRETADDLQDFKNVAWTNIIFKSVPHLIPRQYTVAYLTYYNKGCQLFQRCRPHFYWLLWIYLSWQVPSFATFCWSEDCYVCVSVHTSLHNANKKICCVFFCYTGPVMILLRKLERKTPFSFSNSDIMMINYPTLHKCSISAAIMICHWHHVLRTLMILTVFSLPAGAAPSCAVIRASSYYAVWPQLPKRAAHLADLQPHGFFQAPDSPL